MRILLIIFLLLSSFPALAQHSVLQGLVEYSPGQGRIGVRVSPGGRVMRVRPQSPAERCGIVIGDKIIKADGKDYPVGRIHGQAGTTVELTIKRGENIFVRQIERVNEHLLSPYLEDVASGAKP